MNRKFIGILSVVLCLLLVLTGCSGSNNAETDKETQKAIPLRINYSQTEANLKAGDPLSVSLVAFTDYLEKNAPGVFDVKIYWGNQLSSTFDEKLTGVKNGGFEMANEAYLAMGGQTDAFMPLNFPFLITSYEQAGELWNGPVGQKMRAEAEKDMGVKIIFTQPTGFRHITNSRGPIKTPADMQGLKIRTMNDPYQVAAMGAMGAAPTPMAWSELFTALQQKVVDAQENPIMNIYNARMYEVQKYVTKTGHNYGMAGLFVSQAWYDKLSDDAKKILADAGAEAEKVNLEQLKKVEGTMEEDLKAKGMEIYQLTPEELKLFQEAVKPVYADIKGKIGDDYYSEVMKEAGVQ